MKPFVEKYLIDCRNDRRTNYGDLHSMNPRMRLCKYGPGGIFQKHFDGPILLDDNLISRITIMAYLNDIHPDEGGGATKFYNRQDYRRNTLSVLRAQVQPEAGLVVIFPHDTMHDGALCKAEQKYIMRSDFFFPV